MGLHNHGDDDSTKGMSKSEKKTEGVNRRSRAVSMKIWKGKQKTNKSDGKGTR